MAEALVTRYHAVQVRILRPEYLTAIALQTGRAKDKERVVRLLESGTLDRDVLSRIVEKYGLTDKLRKLEEGGGNE